MLAVRKDRKAEFGMTQGASSYRGDDAVGPRVGGHGEATALRFGDQGLQIRTNFSAENLGLRKCIAKKSIPGGVI